MRHQFAVGEAVLPDPALQRLERCHLPVGGEPVPQYGDDPIGVRVRLADQGTDSRQGADGVGVVRVLVDPPTEPRGGVRIQLPHHEIGRTGRTLDVDDHGPQRHGVSTTLLDRLRPRVCPHLPEQRQGYPCRYSSPGQTATLRRRRGRPVIRPRSPARWAGSDASSNAASCDPTWRRAPIRTRCFPRTAMWLTSWSPPRDSYSSTLPGCDPPIGRTGRTPPGRYARSSSTNTPTAMTMRSASWCAAAGCSTCTSVRGYMPSTAAPAICSASRKAPRTGSTPAR